MATEQIIWIDFDVSGNAILYISTRLSASIYTPRSVFWSSVADPPANPFDSTGMMGMSSGAIAPALAADRAFVLGLLMNSGNQICAFQDSLTAPVEVDITNQPQGNPWFTNTAPWNWPGAQGPFKYNGSWWIIGVLPDTSFTGIASSVRVYKSTSKLGPYTGQDTAHEPSFLGFGLLPQSGAGAFRWDGTSNLLRCVYMDVTGTNDILLNEFDMNTGRWGTAHDGFTNTITGVWDIAALASGDVVIFYKSNASGRAFPDLFCSTLSSGTWGSTLNITAGITSVNSIRYNQTVLDPNGSRLHNFWDYTTGGNVQAVYQPISGGALGTLHNFATDAGMTADQHSFGHGEIGLDGDSLLMGADTDLSAFGAGTGPGVYVGNPLSAPTWTIEYPDTTTLAQTSTCTYMTYGGTVPTTGKLVPKYFRPRIWG